MLAVLLYTGCDCYGDLRAAERNGNYQVANLLVMLEDRHHQARQRTTESLVRRRNREEKALSSAASPTCATRTARRNSSILRPSRAQALNGASLRRYETCICCKTASLARPVCSSSYDKGLLIELRRGNDDQLDVSAPHLSLYWKPVRLSS